jgi:hypothetical protein
MNISSTACMVAFGLIGASLYTMMKCEDCPPFNAYKDSLSSELLRLHSAVVNERMTLYMKGMGLGIALAFMYLWKTKGTVSPVGNGCVFTAIVMVTQYLFYTLSKKEYHMLPNLQTTEQVNGWYAVYGYMKQRYHVGMLFGLVGYYLLGWAMSK